MNRIFLWIAAVSLGLSALPSEGFGQGFLIPRERREPCWNCIRHRNTIVLKSQRVEVRLKGRTAQTTVYQEFFNKAPRVMEATYIFPLPAGAVVSNFVLYINGKPVKGQVLERKRADQIYRSIVSKMRDPGILEYMGGKLFKARIYPVPARGIQKIKLSFSQVISATGGLYKFEYPLKFPKTLIPLVGYFSMSIKLESSIPIKNIYSPTHRVSISKKGDRLAIVGFEAKGKTLGRNFILYYSVSPKDLGADLLAYRPKGERGYFLLMLTPKVSIDSKELVGKSITFVIDTSGSMRGKKIYWAKKALIYCLKNLNSDDTFNIVKFSTDVESLFSDLKAASKENIQKGVKFVEKLEAAGGTDINGALTKALSYRPQQAGLSIIVFLTDGHPTVGTISPRAILKNIKKKNRYKTKIFTFGIGYDINTKLLDKIAEDSGGSRDYVAPNREIAKRIKLFFDKVRYPVMTDIQLSVGKNVKIYDYYPKKISAIFRGDQILIFGRYRGEGASAITVTGKVGKEEKKYVYEVNFPAQREKDEFIAKLWAHRKVAYLLDYIRLNGESKELRDEIVRLGKKFGIVTPYTSYLVVEEGMRIPRPIAPIYRRIGRGRAMPSSAMPRAVRRKARKRMRYRPSAVPPMPGDSFAAEASPPPAPMGLQGFQKSSGASAVRTSKKLKELKRKSTLSPEGKSRFVGGRAFVLKNGVWVDTRYKPKKMKVVRIKYLSSNYFLLLRLRPDLKKFLALGNRVIIAISNKKAIEIGKREDKISKGALEKFLKK